MSGGTTENEERYKKIIILHQVTSLNVALKLKVDPL